MSRRNPTHTSRLARALTQATDLTYAQALALCTDAAAKGALPARLDATGMQVALARLTAAVRTGQPVTGLAPDHLGRDSAGNPFTVTARQMATHTAVVGACGTGKTATAQRLAALRAGDGWDVIVLDLSTAGAQAASSDWAAASCGRGFAQVPADQAGDMTARPGMTYVHQPRRTSAAASGLAAMDDALAGIVSLAVARAFGEVNVERHLLVVLDDAPHANRDLVLELLARARAARIGVLLTCQGPSAWSTGDPAGSDWDRVIANVNVIVAHRLPAAEAGDVEAALVDRDPEAPPTSLQHLDVGHAAVNVLAPDSVTTTVTVAGSAD